MPPKARRVILVALALYRMDLVRARGAALDDDTASDLINDIAYVDSLRRMIDGDREEGHPLPLAGVVEAPAPLVQAQVLEEGTPGGEEGGKA